MTLGLAPTEATLAASVDWIASQARTVTGTVVAVTTLVVAVLGLLLFVKWVAQLELERRRHLAHDDLRTALTEPDVLPLAALEAVGEWGFVAVIQALYRAREELGDPAAKGVERALHVLGAQEPLVRMARSRFRRRRVAGLQLLGLCGGAAAVPILRGLLHHPDDMTRRYARRALVQVGPEDGLWAALRSFVVDEPNPHGWRAAFYSHVGLRSPDILLRWGYDEPLSERHSKLVLEALGAVGYQDVRGLAIASLDAEDAELRASAARTLGGVGQPGDFHLLEQALKDSAWFVRSAAARAMGTFPAPRADAHAALQASLADDSWWVRANAAESLCRLYLDSDDVRFEECRLPEPLKATLAAVGGPGKASLLAALRRPWDSEHRPMIVGDAPNPAEGREPRRAAVH